MYGKKIIFDKFTEFLRDLSFKNMEACGGKYVMSIF